MIARDERREVPELAIEHLNEFLGEVDNRSTRDLRALGLAQTIRRNYLRVPCSDNQADIRSASSG